MNIHKRTSYTMNENRPNSNTNPIKRHIILPQNPTTTLNEKNLNYLGIKTTTRTPTQVFSISAANKFYIESSRSLNKRIYEHTKYF